MSGVPIYGFVGPNGSGKTLCAVETLVRPALERGRTIVSTCFVEGETAMALESPRQLRNLPWGCVLLLDEISSCFPSRQSASMPPEVGRTLNQLRKRDITVGWTGPSWGRCDKILREVTDRVTLSSGYWDSRTLAERRAADASAWPSNQLFRWKTFTVTHGDTFKVEDTQTDRGARRLKPDRARWYRRPKDGTGAQGLYRTLDEVLLLDHLEEFGNCPACAGKRDRPRCKCTPAQRQFSEPLRPWSVVQAELDLEAGRDGDGAEGLALART